MMTVPRHFWRLVFTSGSVADDFRLIVKLALGTHFGCFVALFGLQYGPAKAGFRLKAGTTNFRTGVCCSTEL